MRRIYLLFTALAALSLFFVACGEDDTTKPNISDVKPVIIFADPDSGAVGEEIYISGTDFGTEQGESAVSFNGTDAADIAIWSDLLIKVTVPVGTTSGKISVSVDGQVSNEVDFSIVHIPLSCDILGKIYDASIDSLDLRYKDLYVLPDCIGHLTNLVWLNISDNYGLKELPVSIIDLVNLEYLDLSYDGFATFPKHLTKLTNLKELILYKNSLGVLPDDIGNLNNLTYLSLVVNNIEYLPDSFYDLSNLTALNLGGNKLSIISDKISNLTNLEYLLLGSNNFISVPENICKLYKLKRLVLSYNDISSLPDNFGELENLESLNVQVNNLTSLPESFSNLKKLKTLLARGNKFSESEKQKIYLMLPECEIYF